MQTACLANWPRCLHGLHEEASIFAFAPGPLPKSRIRELARKLTSAMWRPTVPRGLVACGCPPVQSGKAYVVLKGHDVCFVGLREMRVAI
eukprot:2738998-Alexandrium_andersonii.AAC.1